MDTSVALDLQEVKRDDSLTDKDVKKIMSYYGLAVTAFLGEGFCLLRGKQMTATERHQLTYLGALTGLFDDFFDEKNMTKAQILELINTPESALPANAHETLFLRFYNKALAGNNPALIKEYFKKVFDAQVLSERQKDRSIHKEEIKEVTFQKGGISILFYRSVFEEVITADEYKLLYSLGALGQLENDIFDVYKDHQESIKTLATTTTSIQSLKETYVSLFCEVFTLLEQTGFSTSNKKQFAAFVSLIGARGLVCLDVLQQAEKTTGGIFKLDTYTRNQLICDMDTRSSQWKLIKYYSKKNYSVKNI